MTTRSSSASNFSRTSHALTTFAGSGAAMGALSALAAVWLISGAMSAWNRPWELVMTAGAPLLTLALVIVLQHSQNRNARALHIKLNELVSALEGPDDHVVTVEEEPDEELERLERRYHDGATR